MANGENIHRVLIDSTGLYTLTAPGDICCLAVTDEGTPGAKTTVIAINGAEFIVVKTATEESTLILPGPPGPVRTVEATTLGTGCKVRLIRKSDC